MKNQKGFTLVEGLLIIVIIAAVGFSGWFVWNKNNSSEQQANSKSADNNKTSDLEASDNTMDSVQTVEIPEMGLKITVTGDIGKVEYRYEQGSNRGMATLSTDRLSDIDEHCSSDESGVTVLVAIDPNDMAPTDPPVSIQDYIPYGEMIKDKWTYIYQNELGGSCILKTNVTDEERNEEKSALKAFTEAKIEVL